MPGPRPVPDVEVGHGVQGARAALLLLQGDVPGAQPEQDFAGAAPAAAAPVLILGGSGRTAMEVAEALAGRVEGACAGAREELARALLLPGA